MSSNMTVSRENLDACLKELAREFRRLNGTKIPAEIILVGGAAILANYGFRETTYDIDAVIVASSAMKDAINRVGDRLGLPRGWLNSDFTRTASYSDRIRELSVYYRTFSNIVSVRTITAEYLIAMKLMSGRKYKSDLSDIIGILWEHQTKGTPIERIGIERAFEGLYGASAVIPPVSLAFLEDVFSSGDYEALYRLSRDGEQQARQVLLDFEQAQGARLKEEDIESVLQKAMQEKMRQQHGKSSVMRAIGKGRRVTQRRAAARQSKSREER